jgi:hypothetical protein
VNDSLGVDKLNVNILMTIGLFVAVFASVAALLNTQIIIREMSEIKAKLGINEIKKSSLLDKDLDNE